MTGIVASLILKGVQTSDARRENHANLVAVDTLGEQVGILNGLLGTRQCILRVQVVALEVLHLATVVRIRHVVQRIETLELTGKMGLEQGGVKMSNRSRTAHSFKGVVPSGLNVQSKGSDGTETGYHNSL